ncbi:MAG: glycoside hydrolase family 15 protein [Thermaerobacter sp.]|nr:glycoside hydrolase family 15 protein [Thermaerobacter sp.]
MPRDIPLGNGQLLVNFDLDYHLVDIFFPYVGKENQTDGHISRLGVFRAGSFAWLPDDGWRRVRQQYAEGTMVSDCCFEHDGLGIRLSISDAVDFHENILIRALRVEDLSPDQSGEVRLFFHHDFHLLQTAIGDCAFYDPAKQVVIQYKEDRYALIGGSSGGTSGILQYSIGVKESNHLDGTWRDAEDGVLDGNPVSLGAVDSTVGLSVQPGETAYLWVCLGTSEDEVLRLHEGVLHKSPQEFLRRTADYWRAWLHTEGHELPADLPAEIHEHYLRCLLIARTQIDQHGGILAGNDWSIRHFNSDTYSYVWSRDAAITADAFDRAGYEEVARRFFDFCLATISKGGYFLQKYNPDGSPGSTPHARLIGTSPRLPIQEDETALVLWALWRHFRRHRHVEEIRRLFRPLIVLSADFLASYRDPDTGLPLPSHDIWEERWGVTTFTAAATWAGLEAAAGFADTFGEGTLAQSYRDAAQGIRHAALQYLYRPEDGRFSRMAYIDPETGRITGYDPVPDISLLGLVELGFLPPEDERLQRTVEHAITATAVHTDVGGFARYPGDVYQRTEESVDVPGNPWDIASLWVARWRIARAMNKKELDAALGLVRWNVEHALPSGVMAEQVHPRTHAPLSVSPLTWSHAFFVATVQDWADKLRALQAQE